MEYGPQAGGLAIGPDHTAGVDCGLSDAVKVTARVNVTESSRLRAGLRLPTPDERNGVEPRDPA